MTAPSAYQIEAALAAWHSARQRLLVDDADLERDEAALTDLLGSEDANIQDIIARLLRGAVHAKNMADAASDQMELIRARKDRYLRRSEAMRGAVFAIFEAIGQIKTELPDLTATVRRGAPSVVVTDETAVPDIYVETVVTRKIDKGVIASVLKSGGTVPGAELSNGLPSLAIRTR